MIIERNRILWRRGVPWLGIWFRLENRRSSLRPVMVVERDEFYLDAWGLRIDVQLLSE